MHPYLRRHPRRTRARRHARHGQGLGAHAARLQGRPLVRARLRRLLLRPDPGRRAQHAAQLRGRGHAPHRRLRGRGDRHARAVAGQGPAVRDAGRRASRSSAGSTIPTPIRSSRSGTRSSSCARSPTCGRAPTSSARSTRVRHTHRAGDPPVLPRRTASSGSTRRSSRRRDAEGAGADVPRVDARPREPAARRRDGKIDFAQDFFGRETFLTVSGQLNVEAYCLALSQGLHVRPDVPRRELEHAAGTWPSSG